MASNNDESRHETPISPVTGKAPELTLSIASINNEPIELDSTPASPETLRLAPRGSKATALEAVEADPGLSPAEKERRAQKILDRQADPAVLVDIPQTPQAEELEKSGATKDDSGNATSR
ncbi:hypothetical protein AC579_1506 [Pseudocercospora musae]|uniref:Uncharacterized protein n=1 Tax=Pseudocercospora musae TaxID=113226 RepID=A0A139IKG2_9PEZI|nr:hypothetical protein AC579_1506 [Pseudocercospora musae]